VLSVEGLTGGYGATARVLDGVDLALGEGEVVALMGRNGMGKTTVVRALTGLLARRAGRAAFRGRDLLRLPPHLIARAGVGLVPEGRQVFPTLTVRENLIATAAPAAAPGAWSASTSCSRAWPSATATSAASSPAASSRCSPSAAP
jgi:branched-chain amino acid transport system ATP-binding protein